MNNAFIRERSMNKTHSRIANNTKFSLINISLLPQSYDKPQAVGSTY